MRVMRREETFEVSEADMDEAAPRGADEAEVAYLGSREESVPLKAATLRAMLNPLVAGARRRGAAQGEIAHADGTQLITLYKRHADAVLGFPSFRQMILALWPESEDDAYRRILIAFHCTEEQARAGVSKCERGIRLVQALALSGFAALVHPETPALLKLESGDTVTFAEATVEQLNEALRVAKRKPKVEEDETAGQKLQRTRRQIKDLVEEEPEYAKLRPKAALIEGEVEVTVRARGRAGQKLAARFYEALAAKR